MLASSTPAERASPVVLPLSINSLPQQRNYEAAITQKSFIWENSLILFAGSALAAKVICIQIAREKPSSFSEINAIIQNNISEKISVIHCHNKEGTSSSKNWNCRILEYPEFKVIVAGSGADALVWEAHNEPAPYSGPDHEYQPMLAMVYNWIEILFRSEWEDPEHIDMRFGAGYEMFEPNRPNGFCRISWRLDSLIVQDASSEALSVGLAQSIFFMPSSFGTHIFKVIALEETNQYEALDFFVPRILDIPHDAVVNSDFEKFVPRLIYTFSRSDVGASLNVGNSAFLDVVFEEEIVRMVCSDTGREMAESIQKRHHEKYKTVNRQGGSQAKA